MWREEFEFEMAKLNHPDGADFSLCNWQGSRSVKLVWLFYRIFTFLYYFGTLLYVFITWITEDNISHGGGKYFIFMSNWSHIVQGVVFFLAFLVTAVDFAIQWNDSEAIERLTCLKKTFWFTYTMSLPCTVVVCLGFWFGVYTPDTKIKASTIILHATNGLVHIIDFFLVAFPYRFFHFYMPDSLIFIYVLFSIIYELSGGTGTKGGPIYELLDWKKYPYRTFSYATVFLVGLYFIHIIFFLFYMMKRLNRTKKETGTQI